MAIRYTPAELLVLRESPLCTKPPNLPAAEEWMGPPAETFRNQTKTTTDRSKGTDISLLDQANRRPAVDRHVSRSNPSTDDIILGPPRMSFASATTMRNAKSGEGEKAPRETEARERFNFRSNKATDSDGNERLRDRDGRNAHSNFRRRGDADQDNEGWSTVKPRKSFGHEGAERFHGRMGGGDRYNSRDERRVRDRDDRENSDRRNRNFDSHARDKDGDETDGPRRNGLARGRSELWFKDGNEGSTARERIDRTKSWRDREDKPDDRHGERTNERNYERRLDRDREQRVERDPEWLDEPAGEKSQGHTEEDFKKFMEAMKANKGGPQKTEEKQSEPVDGRAPDAPAEPERPKAEAVAAVETGPDKFFAAFGPSSTMDLGNASASTDKKEGPKPKTAKPSRFTSFFASQEDGRGRTEPPTPATAAPANGANTSSPQSDADKEAFQVLLQKLQTQTMAQTLQASTVPSTASTFPDAPSSHEVRRASAVTSPEPFQHYGGDRREDPRQDARQDPRLRAAPHPGPEILAPRPMLPPSQPPSVRPDQVLQELVGQRHQASSQGSGRMEQTNAEVLMQLMQRARNAPEPLRTEQLLLRMPQPNKQISVPQLQDREHEYQRERSASQRQMRGQAPPGFLDDQFHGPEGDSRPQPTQILQRPPPPGLDHQMHPFSMGGGPLPPQRPMIPPPPGLVSNPRSAPPPGMFPPNFPPGAFPPPDAMAGPPPRGMQPPPGFYGGPPPPGFMPPPVLGGFQGPDGLAFAAPFDGRGMPPPGAGGNFRRS